MVVSARVLLLSLWPFGSCSPPDGPCFPGDPDAADKFARLTRARVLGLRGLVCGFECRASVWTWAVWCCPGHPS